MAMLRDNGERGGERAVTRWCAQAQFEAARKSTMRAGRKSGRTRGQVALGSSLVTPQSGAPGGVRKSSGATGTVDADTIRRAGDHLFVAQRRAVDGRGLRRECRW